MKVDFSPVAKEDLFDVAVFIAQDNLARAIGFVDELETQCLGIGRTPGIGTARPEWLLWVASDKIDRPGAGQAPDPHPDGG